MRHPHVEEWAAFEAKFLQDEDLKFRLRAKRNKKIAEWAAILVNKENDENYITEVRQSDLEKPGDDDIIDKLLSDFKKNKVDMNREKIVEKLNEFENSSKNEIIDN